LATSCVVITASRVDIDFGLNVKKGQRSYEYFTAGKIK